MIGVGGIAGISLEGRGPAEAARRRNRRPGLLSVPRVPADARCTRLIAADVQQRYVLSYTPNNQMLDGTWRTITVKTSDPTHVVQGPDRLLRTRAAADPPADRAHDSRHQPAVRGRRRRRPGRPRGRRRAEGRGLPGIDGARVGDAGARLERQHERAAPAVMEAARAVRRVRCPPKTRSGSCSFADKADMAHDLTTHPRRALDAIKRYQSQGGTALYDALSRVSSGSSGSRAVGSWS